MVTPLSAYLTARYSKVPPRVSRSVRSPRLASPPPRAPPAPQAECARHSDALRAFQALRDEASRVHKESSPEGARSALSKWYLALEGAQDRFPLGDSPGAIKVRAAAAAAAPLAAPANALRAARPRNSLLASPRPVPPTHTNTHTHTHSMCLLYNV